MRLTKLAGLAVLSLALLFTTARPSGAAANKEKLKDPKTLNEKAPDVYKAKFDTSKGSFVIEVTRAWAPNGADRFYNLVKNGWFEDTRFFRVVSGFMVQFGLNGDPALNTVLREARITDDPVKESNTRGKVTFATSGPNSRTTQIFINFGDNARLDGQGFSPFGTIVEGMDVVDKLNAEYGEGAPRGRGPDQGRIQGEGNAYLTKDFPNMDYIKSATIVGGGAPKEKAAAKTKAPATQESK